MNIYDTAHKLAEEIKRSDECVQLAELRERAYADETNRLLLEEYKRLQVQLQMSMVGAAGEMPSEDMQRFQQLASLLYMNSDVQAYLMAEMQMQKTLADIFKILTEAAGIRFDVLHTPGHTPGSVCYRAGDVLFTGDTLFRHECGRCDLEGGDFSAMLRSLKRLSELEGDYKVLPGHEGISTLDEERVANPYMLQARGR